MTSNYQKCRCIRRLSTGAVLAGAAAVIGMGGAHADTPDDVIGQAMSDLNQGTAVLETASTADLSARSAELISGQGALSTEFNTALSGFASLQDALSPGDQSLLADVDELLVSAAQNVVSADQAVVAADQAGDLSSNSFLPVDFTVFGADLNLIGAALEVDGAGILADLTGGVASSATDLTSSLDPAMIADLLSSGL